MPVESVIFSLLEDGKAVFPGLPQLFSKAASEITVVNTVLTSNQSGLAINFGGVSSGQSVFIHAEQGITASMNSITAVLQTNGIYFHHLTSLTTLTVTNDQTTALARVRVALFST